MVQTTACRIEAEDLRNTFSLSPGRWDNACWYASDVCGANSTCTTKQANPPDCGCRTGYEGWLKGVGCSDIKECSKTDKGGCTAHSACVEDEGTYRCDCAPGYVGNGRPDRKGCTMDDYCAKFGEPGPCHPLSRCVPTATAPFYVCEIELSGIMPGTVRPGTPVTAERPMAAWTSTNAQRTAEFPTVVAIHSRTAPTRRVVAHAAPALRAPSAMAFAAVFRAPHAPTRSARRWRCATSTTPRSASARLAIRATARTVSTSMSALAA